MNAVRRRNLLLFGGAISVAYWIAALVLGVQLLIVLASAVLIAIGCAVIWAYGMAAARALRNDWVDPPGQAAIAITLAWVGIIGNRLFNLGWRLTESHQPQFLHSPAVLMLLFVLSMAGAISICAPRPQLLKGSPYGWGALIIAIAVGSATIGGIIAAEIIAGIPGLQSPVGP